MPDPNLIPGLDAQTQDLQQYLDYLKTRPKPVMPTPVPQQAEPTMNDQVKNRFLENSELLRRLRGGVPASPPPEQPMPGGGSFQPGQWVNDYMKNFRPTPGSMQPSQWSKLPPASVAPQPGRMLVPYRGGMPPVPSGGGASLAPSGGSPPALLGGVGSGGPTTPAQAAAASGMGRPGLGPAAALIAALQPTRTASNDTDPQAATPGNLGRPVQYGGVLPPAWTPSAASRPWPPQAVPQAVPLPRPRPQVPLPRPRPQIPAPVASAIARAQPQAQPQAQPSGLDQFLKALLGNPVSRDRQLVGR